MSEALPNNTEPAISANEGWQQMHSLLNEYLPVKRKLRDIKFLVRCAYISIILPVFLFTTLQLDNNIFHLYPVNNITGITLFKDILTPALMSNGNNSSTLNAKKLPANFNSFKSQIVGSSFPGKKVSQINPDSTDRTLTQTGGTTNSSRISIAKNIIEGQNGGTIHAPLNAIPVDVTLFHTGKDNNKVIANRSWNLFAGMGINTAIDGSQNFQPYPVAEARYNINPLIYIAAGLSAWSPVSTNAAGTSKTFYVSDTMNNISLNDETTVYSHLHYLDIPLSLGIKVNKNISIQAGIQMSLLLHKRTEKILSPYPSVTAPLSAIPAGMEHRYDVQVNKIDYRFITGIRYTLKQTVIGLTYQHGLQSVGSGIYTNKNSNHVLALNVLFQLR